MFVVKGVDGKHTLDRWLAWAQRCRIPAFVTFGRWIRKHRAAIDASLEHGLSNGLIESDQHQDPPADPDRVRMPSHPEALIALAMLALGGHRPALPGRKTTHG